MMAVAVCLIATVLPFASATAQTEDDIARVRALEADGRVDAAVEHLRTLLTDESREPSAELLLELARLTDDPSEALALADEALRTARDAGVKARAHTMRGDYLYAAGHYALAAVEYAAAAERGMPEHPALRHAASLLELGDVAGAVRVFDGVMGSEDNDVAAWAAIGRGRALLAGGELEEAAEKLEALAERLAGDANVTHALAAAAEARTALGQFGRARELLVTLMTEAPQSAEATLAEHRVRLLDTRIAELSGETGDAAPDSAGAAPADEEIPGQ